MTKDCSIEEGLYRPISVGGLKLSHRLVKVPGFQDKHPACEMTSSEESGNLIIACGIFPQLHAIEKDEDEEFYGYSKRQMQIWTESCRQVHERGSYVFVQLFSTGRLGEQRFLEGHSGKDPVGGFPNSLSREEIQLYVNAYVRAAKASMMTGADGVELHGASGYLLDKFLNAKVNRRTDVYGGTIVNRAKFILEVVDAVVEAIGASRVGIRLSPSGGEMSLVAQYSYLLGQLERRAVWGRRLAYINLEESLHESEEDQVEHFGSSHTFVYSIWRGIVIRAHSELSDVLKECDRTLVAYERPPETDPHWQSSSKFHSRTPLGRPGHVMYANDAY